MFLKYYLIGFFLPFSASILIEPANMGEEEVHGFDEYVKTILLVIAFLFQAFFTRIEYI